MGGVLAGLAWVGCASTPADRFDNALREYRAAGGADAAAEDPELEALEARRPGIAAAVRAHAVTLRDGRPAERRAALGALSAFGPEATEALRVMLARDRRLLATFGAPGDADISILARTAAEGDASARAALAVAAPLRAELLLAAAADFPLDDPEADDRLHEVAGYGPLVAPALRAFAIEAARPWARRTLALHVLRRVDPAAAADAATAILARAGGFPDAGPARALVGSAAGALVAAGRRAALPECWRLAADRRSPYRADAIRTAATLLAPGAPEGARLLPFIGDADGRVAVAALAGAADWDAGQAGTAAHELLAPGAPRGPALGACGVAAAHRALASALAEDLRAAAGTGPADLRGAAVASLLAHGLPGAAEALQAGLTAADPAVQVAVCTAAVAHAHRAEARTALPAVIAAFAAPEPEVRRAALALAGALGRPHAADALLAHASGDAPADERAAALEALGRLRPIPADLAARLPPGLFFADDAVLTALLRLLWLAGDARMDPWWRPVVAALPPAARAEGYALLAGGDARREVGDALTVGLRADEPSVRIAAARALAWHGGHDAVSFLRPLLEDPDHGVRAVVAAALGRVGAADAVPDLAMLLGGARPEARAAAVQALSLLPRPDAGRLIRAALGDLAPSVRAAAATGLGLIGTPADAPLLARLAARDADAGVRAAAGLAHTRLAPTTRSPAGIFTTLAGADRTRAERVAGAAALAAAGNPAPRAALAESLAADATRGTARALAAARDLVTLGLIPEAHAAFALARELATTPADAAAAAVGTAGIAAQAGDAAGIVAALADAADALAAVPDLPALVADGGALGRWLAGPEGRRAVAPLVRAAGGPSLLDRFAGPATVVLRTGGRIPGDVLGWVDERLCLRRAGGRLFFTREQISAVVFEE